MSVLILDDKASGGPCGELRPGRLWNIASPDNTVSTLMKLYKRLRRGSLPISSSRILVFLHLNVPRLLGDRLGPLVCKTACRHGAKLVFFSGGRIEDPLPPETEPLIQQLKEGNYISGRDFLFADWHDLDEAMIRRIADNTLEISSEWRVDVLLNDLSRSESDLLGALEVLAGRKLDSKVREMCIKIDKQAVASRLLAKRRPQTKDVHEIERLIAWLGQVGPTRPERVPERAVEWVASARAVRLLPVLPDREGEFKKQRDWLSHSLFGNDFANKLGDHSKHLDGYWRVLSDRALPGDKDESESVTTAFNRWPTVLQKVRAFTEDVWPVGEEVQGRLKRDLLDSAERVSFLVAEAPSQADKSDGDRASFRKQLEIALGGMLEILRSIGKSL